MRKLMAKSNTTSYGWNFGSSANYVRVEGFEVYGFKWAGFWSNSGADNIYIYSNRIHDIGRWNGCPSYMYGRPGIFQGIGTTYHTYDSNIFYTIGRFPAGTPDGICETHYYTHDHGIYFFGNHNTIVNNIFYDLKAGWPLAISSNCTNGIRVLIIMPIQLFRIILLILLIQAEMVNLK